MHNQSKGIIYAIVTALFWGVLAVALKVAVRRVDPPTIVWFRFVLAFIPLCAWSLIQKPKHLRILVKPPILLIIAAVALAFNYLGFNLGVQYTSPGNAQLFVQTGQILLALAGIFFFGEKFTRVQATGFVLAIAGLLIFYNQQLFHFANDRFNYNKGIFITLAAAVSWAIYAVLQKKLVVRHSAAALNLFLFGLPALLYLPVVNFSQLAGLNFMWWLLLAFLGLNTLVAYSTLALSLRYLEASKVSIILIMNPVVTFIMMAILTATEAKWIDPEKFTFLSVAGAATVIAGAMMVIWKRRIA
jgi:drug/metabolite transporter (DMT)-like permease